MCRLLSRKSTLLLSCTTVRAVGRNRISLNSCNYGHLNKRERKFLDKCQWSGFTSVKQVPKEGRKVFLCLCFSLEKIKKWGMEWIKEPVCMWVCNYCCILSHSQWSTPSPFWNLREAEVFCCHPRRAMLVQCTASKSQRQRGLYKGQRPYCSHYSKYRSPSPFTLGCHLIWCGYGSGTPGNLRMQD